MSPANSSALGFNIGWMFLHWTDLLCKNIHFKNILTPTFVVPLCNNNVTTYVLYVDNENNVQTEKFDAGNKS